MACNHFEPVLECEALAVLQQEHRALAYPPTPTLQPGAPLFAIRVCLLLAVLAQWLCGRFWKCSSASGAGRGLFPTTHVAAIKRRKGPCSRGPLLLPALLEIPQSRCYSNWTHFQLLKEGRKEGGTLPAATLHPIFKWWTMRLNICCQPTDISFIVRCGIFPLDLSPLFSYELSKFNLILLFFLQYNTWVIAYKKKYLNILKARLKILKEFNYNIFLFILKS